MQSQIFLCSTKNPIVLSIQHFERVKGKARASILVAVLAGPAWWTKGDLTASAGAARKRRGRTHVVSLDRWSPSSDGLHWSRFGHLFALKYGPTCKES